MWHPDEGLVHTWLDGAASADESRSIEAHIGSCDDCRAVVLEARGLIAGSSRIVGALDSVPGSVIPAELSTFAGGGVATIAAGRVRKPSFWRSPAFRIAASLLFVVGVSSIVVQNQRQSGSGIGLIAKAEKYSTLQSKSESLSSPSTSTTVPSSGTSGVAAAKKTPAPVAGVAEMPLRRESDEKLGTRNPVGAVAAAGSAASVDSSRLAKGNLTGATTAADSLRVLPLPTQSAVARGVAPPIQSQQVQQVQQQGRQGVALQGLAGKAQAMTVDRSSAAATKLEKLAPVVRAELLGRDSAVVGRAEQESLGCYQLTAVSVDDDARRKSLANLLGGLVELESGPNANSLNEVTRPPVATAQGGAASAGGAAGAGARAGGAGAGAGAGGGGGGGGAAGAGAAGRVAAGGGGAAGGGRGGGGGGGGRGAGRGAAPPPARVDTMLLMRARSLGWRMNTPDTLEMYVMIDTTRVAITLMRSRDSTLTGIAKVTSDSTSGVIGNVTATRAQCF